MINCHDHNRVVNMEEDVITAARSERADPIRAGRFAARLASAATSGGSAMAGVVPGSNREWCRLQDSNL